MVIKCPATPKNHLDNPGAYELNHHPLFEPLSMGMVVTWGILRLW